MRNIKKTFNFTKCTVLKKNVVVSEFNVDGVLTENQCAIDYIRDNGYSSDLKFECSKVSSTYVMTARDFMKYGDKVESVEEHKPTETNNPVNENLPEVNNKKHI